MQDIVHDILYNNSYIQLILLSFVYFCVLYFVLAPCFSLTCKWLENKGLISKIVDIDVEKKQFWLEVKHSLSSIVVFAFSIVPIVYLIRMNIITPVPNNFWSVCLGVLLLTVWNEVHFYTVHRMMHLPFFMKHVHYIHHQSKVPTVYSVYSFHWFEAFLLSTVPLTLALLIDLPMLSIVLYPLVSILFNYAGHCNYRFGNGKGKSWKLFGTFHNQHHFNKKKNFGFVSNILDNLFVKKH